MPDPRATSNPGGTRYRHSNRSGASQDQGERKDESWQSRQGGRQSHEEGAPSRPGQRPPAMDRGGRLGGTNTQGGLAGIREASRESEDRLEAERPPIFDAQGEIPAGAGTDQPPRMGGPLGPDPRHPHLPEGLQDNDEKGTGARGFDRGVDATNIGAPYQGARVEDPSRATEPED